MSSSNGKQKKSSPASPRPAQFERVYFVGAGLSAGIGYPVGSDLMRELLDFLDGRVPSKHKGLSFENVLRKRPEWLARAKQIRQVFEQVLNDYFAAGADSVGQVDLAEFFTMANTLAEMPRLFAGAETASYQTASEEGDRPPSEATLFEDLSAVTRTYFNEICDCWHRPDDFASVLRTMDPERHAVISFNWDEELDIALTERFGIQYTLNGWMQGEGILLLKPHGSIGWYDVKQGLGNDDLEFIASDDERIPRGQRRILYYNEAERPYDIDGEEHPPLSCPPVITPPTFAKRFEYLEQQLIWQDVLQVCSTAWEFVFLGYSMPKDDILTRAAIRRALRDNPDRTTLNCVICDRSFDDAKRANFQTVFGEGLSRKSHLPVGFGNGGRKLGQQLSELLKVARLLQ